MEGASGAPSFFFVHTFPPTVISVPPEDPDIGPRGAIHRGEDWSTP